jgi:hypothetical protein
MKGSEMFIGRFPQIEVGQRRSVDRRSAGGARGGDLDAAPLERIVLPDDMGKIPVGPLLHGLRRHPGAGPARPPTTEPEPRVREVRGQLGRAKFCRASGRPGTDRPPPF